MKSQEKKLLARWRWIIRYLENSTLQQLKVNYTLIMLFLTGSAG